MQQFGPVRPGDRIHSSIPRVGGAVLRRTHGQVGSHIPEHHRMGELLTVMEYLTATETVGAVPKEAHGCLEGLRAQEGGHGSEVSFSTSVSNRLASLWPYTDWQKYKSWWHPVSSGSL